MSTAPTAPAAESDGVREPPGTVGGVLKQLGPGLIIAAAIVGSGELIATTLTGATGGIALLWLIVIGCVIKVFVQIEIGRATIIRGEPTLTALDSIPGPRVRGRGNWLVWYWFAMWFCSISQLGGIAGSCGQALAIVWPLTAHGEAFVAQTQEEIDAKLAATAPDVVAAAIEEREVLPGPGPEPGTPLPAAGKPLDDRLWCIPIAIVTSVLLLRGRYSTIQTVSTTLVAVFTAVTVWNVMAIQRLPRWRITGEQFIEGISFGLPTAESSFAAVAIALSTVGIIGVGAAELIQYPYWCLEKGYAKWTGRNDGSEAWTRRAAGWLRVMQVDAWCSLVIYTFATIAFFILGVAILHRSSLVPEGAKLLQTLMTMYAPVFGSIATPVFIAGAIAVLYSTFFVGNASHARTFTDAMAVTGVIVDTPASRVRWIKILSGVFPMLCLAIYWLFPQPGALVLLSGAAQMLMLPMLGYAAIVFRYRDTPPALRPGRIWDSLLWISVVAMALLAAWQVTKYALDAVRVERENVSGVAAPALSGDGASDD